MKIITVEEHFMSQKVNDCFMELNPPKDKAEVDQAGFVKLFMGQDRFQKKKEKPNP